MDFAGYDEPSARPDQPSARPDQPSARRRVSRRALLQASVAGGIGVATVPAIALVHPLTQSSATLKPGNASYPLNSDWLFGGDYQAGNEAMEFDDSSFIAVTLPHNATDLSWRNWSPPTWQRTWIYRRHFSGAPLLRNKPGQKAGNRVFVDFDGVMVNASVVCNNQVVGQHQGGYLPFSSEITGSLSKKDNVLSVIVDSRCLPVPPIATSGQPSSIDYLQPGGIYRDVGIRVVPHVFVSDLFALPQNVLSQNPAVSVECTIDAGPDAKKATGKATLVVELVSSGGQSVASHSSTLDVSKQGLAAAHLTLSDLGPVSLWSVNSPVLYTVRATLNVPGVGVSALTRQIGFREAVFKTSGFYLNGQRLQLFGLDRHQLFPYTGMAMPARVQRKDAEILKNDFNCNMVRCSHYPQSPAFLDACDELGLLVWEEAPGWDHVSESPQWQDQVVQDVKSMVTRDRSRPSVIIWGTRLNETGNYPQLWAATRQAARELDPSRPSSGAMDQYSTDWWAEDVFGFNDYTVSEQGNATLLPPLPGVPYLITESIGIMENSPPHFTWKDQPAVLAKQAELHAQAHNAARSNTRYAGLLGWAGFDYSSMHQGQPWRVKWAGVADGFRVPKPGAAVYQTQVSPRSRAMIVPVFFWEGAGAEPAGQPLMIASNCDQLVIFIGGKHVLTAQPADNNPLYRNLLYPPFIVSLPLTVAPGDLTVKGYVSGKRVTVLNMSNDQTRDSLHIQADDGSIAADGSDMTRVVFRAVDAYGNQRRYSEGEVALNVSGPGELVGDNPFAFGEYGGLGAVWIRSQAGHKGTITVTAAHPTLGVASTRIRTQGSDSASVPVLPGHGHNLSRPRGLYRAHRSAARRVRCRDGGSGRGNVRATADHGRAQRLPRLHRARRDGWRRGGRLQLRLPRRTGPVVARPGGRRTRRPRRLARRLP
ncbi:MAG TPA: glycoside hydrolase family 2 TIM barrel-domain containing protein [Streptosporangiaceae bacterium]